MTSQVVKVRAENLRVWMTCPLCHKLLREATTISLCLHTFCRKCIYEKLSDEELDSCPVCSIHLGCIPLEKLRQDHDLQDIRANIFPFKRKKIKDPSTLLPVKRKERYLSSLVVSTPKASMRTALTGRRTKTVARKNAPVRASTFVLDKPAKDDCPQSSSSALTINIHIHDERQASGAEACEGKVDLDLWKPLNFLVEAANNTKSSKLNSQDSSLVKSDPLNSPDSEVHVPKAKVKEHQPQSKLQYEKNGVSSLPGTFKRQKVQAVDPKKAAGRLCVSAQAMLKTAGAKRGRRKCPIWFSLVASEDQEGFVPLPQISACYLRIKDGDLPASFIQKYLMKKLDLASEDEVEIVCQGQPVLPTLQLRKLVDLWLRSASSTSKQIRSSVGSSAKDFVTVLSYSRRVQQPNPGK